MSKKKDPMTDSVDPMAALSSGEVRILEPDHALKEALGPNLDTKQIFSPENIERAQNVINEHKDSFLEWVASDIAQLETSYTAAAANLSASVPEIQKLGKAAFIIKSQAGTFGFSLATQVAKSLDDFCNKSFRPTQEHLTVVRKHIDAINIIFHKNISGEGGAVGKELAESIYKLVDKFRDK